MSTLSGKAVLAVCLLSGAAFGEQRVVRTEQPAVRGKALNEVTPVDVSPYVQTARSEVFAALKAKARRDGEVRVIVHVKVDGIAALTAASSGARTAPVAAQADARLAEAIAKGRRREVARLAGVPHEVTHTYKSIPFVTMRVPEQALQRLEDSPGVIGVEEDKQARINLNNTVNIVGASAAWASGFDGTGWYVAVLDTGVRASHEFFGGKDIVQACFATGESGGECPNGLSVDTTSPNAAEPYPSSWYGYDHGTHTSGIAVGNGPSVPSAGVAKGANLIHAKVFYRCTGCCGGSDCLLSNNSDRLAAHDFVYGLRFTYNIAAVSMSLGGGLYADQASCDASNAAEKASIDLLRSAGIATVISSGNDGSCSGIGSPGCISSAIAVGATDDTDTEYGANNWHPELMDIFAPGVAVLSSVASSDTAYASYSGTSMAAPHVAGAWAIIKQADPAASVSEIFNALAFSGQEIIGLCGEPVPQKRDAAINYLGYDACCTEGGTVCTDLTSEECTLIGGKTRPGHFCGELPNPCEEDIKFSQPAGADGEDVASNVDFSDGVPNVVVADDFTSDGRPIRAVRWWGSRISPPPALAAMAAQPDSPGPQEATAPPAHPQRVIPRDIGPAPMSDVGSSSMASAQGVTAAAPTDLGYGTDHIAGAVASFPLNAPYILTFGGTHSPAPLFAAAEFGSNGDCSFMYVLDLYGNTFGKLDVATGIHIVVGPAVPVGAESWSGLARDPTTNTMYAASTDCAGANQIYTIDVATGASAPIGNVAAASCVIAIAFDNAGVMYALDINNDVLLSVDKTTAAGTVLGPIGFDANYSQGMGTDHDTDTIYLAAFNRSPQRAELRTADTTTGATTLVGVIGSVSPGIAELGGFSVPSGCLDLDPDGWFVSFHEPIADPGLTAPPLGLYYCDASIVAADPTRLPSCDDSVVYEYRTSLADCCLVDANGDSRNGRVPAQGDGFFEDRCFDYAIDIQAVIGRRYEDDGAGGCTEVSTGRSFDSDFWGWHTAPDSVGAAFGLGPAWSSTVSTPPPDWQYGPWTPVTPVCSTPNMAFELITDTIGYGDPDEDGDGYPDSCLCELINGAVSEPGVVPFNRYLPFSVMDAQGVGARQAIRIELTDLPEYPSWNGQARWVGPPVEAPDQVSNRPGLTFTVAGLQCEPYFADWWTRGVVNVYGAEIVPGSHYTVQIVEDCCTDLNDPSCYSAALPLDTATFGDVWRLYDVPGNPPQPDFSDIAALVSKFLGNPDLCSGGANDGLLCTSDAECPDGTCEPTAPRKRQAQLVPNVPRPFVAIDFRDIAAAVQAFLYVPYSSLPEINGPCPCPSSETCPVLDACERCSP